MVVTDFDVHAMWLCRHVEQYFVALEETKIHLKAMGVPDSLVTVSGIPTIRYSASPKTSERCVGNTDLPSIGLPFLSRLVALVLGRWGI